MGTTIRDLYESVSRAHEQLPSEVERIIERLSDKIIELNTERQMFEGVDNEGKDLGVYKPLTEELSQGISGKGYPKRAGDPFNTYATGELWKSIDILFNNGNLRFFTNKPNHPFLQKKNAKDLLGLTKDNQYELNYELLKPRILEWLHKTI
ncbi:hypothetical protein AAU57_11970 [Nonlabens sp. YIK11]|uniref:hypothetical protein n=1 Tax=Nonlabens sp. YIK11 TaxID=1453349 RepID=UPI0006DBED80|nr:hypothetical protein [Nonlabens sp. YIK11]KQC33965.1 hypothetical protein AAU57_11970 [Nonlabens sp. YIK11]